jgi:UrcA family protein
MSRLRICAIPVLAAAGLFLGATPAIGQSPEILIVTKKAPPGYEPAQTKVKIGDLNLATAVGVSQMKKRVGNAINSLCPRPSPSRPRYEAQDSKLCRDSAWASAMPQMDEAVHHASHGSGGQR